MKIRQQIEDAIDSAVADISTLSGGCVGQLYRVTLATNEFIVAKVDDSPHPVLDVEGYMLTYLARNSELPVPDVLFAAPHLLLLSFLPGDSHFGPGAQEHAAELLAALHNISAPAFGLEKDTLIGGLHQPNPWTNSWLTFFIEQRLLFMARAGVAANRLPNDLLIRLDKFCAQLDKWLLAPKRPSLIHGDVWTTNVLATGDKISGFVDPAIYFAHAEIELAFTTLFGTFGRPFFDRYQELREIPPGFFEERRDIYNLYPLLVHVRLFGGSYVDSVDQTLRRFGF